MQIGVLPIHPWSAHEQWELVRQICDIDGIADLHGFIGSGRGGRTKEDVSNGTDFGIVAVGQKSLTHGGCV